MKYCAMFHHFHDNNEYPNLIGGGSISAIDFHKIIDFIDENYNLLSPDEYTRKVLNNNLKESDVCLTFDDSLKSQFKIIFPELEKRNLKAFFFVYSAVFSKNPPLLEFFRDFKLSSFKSLDDYYELFFKIIQLNFTNEYKFFLKYYKTEYLSNYPFYSSNDKKYRFLRDVVLKDKYFEVILNIMKEKNYSIDSKKDYLFMSIEDIKILHKSGHSIGLHTHNHPTRLEDLSYEKQLDEYNLNYEYLNSLLQDKVTSMSHPCGSYNKDTLNILKKLGIKVGFRDSLFPSYIKSSLEIPREDHSNIMKLIGNK